MRKLYLVSLLLAVVTLCFSASYPASADAGTWSAMASGTTNHLYGVWAASASNVYASGQQGKILRYNGAGWSAMTSGTTNHLNELWGASPSDIFAVGDHGTILRYNGSFWNAMTSGTGNDLSDVWGSSASDVFAAGAVGTILHYDGTGWSSMSSGVSVNLRGVWGSSSSDIFAVGDNGTALHYNGTAWSSMSSGVSVNLRGVWGSSSSDIFAVGDNGTALHYGGTAWGSTASGVLYDLFDVWGTSSARVFAVGTHGTILNDNGSAWTAMASGTDFPLYGVHGSSASNAFAVGQKGTIVRYQAAAPVITSFLPQTASAGSQVVIYGSSLYDVTSVSFGGVAAAQFTVNGAGDQVTATVGAGAGGPVSVVTPAGTATSSGVFTFAYTITASAGANGTITPSGAVVVNSGANQTFDIAAGANYHIGDVLVDLVSVGALTSYTFNNVTANHSISATFAINTHTVTFAPGAHGTRTGGGELIQTVGHAAAATAPILSVESGWTFTGWDQSFDPVTADLTVNAQYAQNAYTLTMTTVGSGSVSGTPEQATYTYGAVVQLTATPAAGWTFAGWSGDISGSANPGNVTMNGNRSVTATFTQNTYSLTVNTVGSGTVTKNPDQAIYTYGTSVQLTATPVAGWAFTGWSGDFSGSANPANVTMDGNKSISANFAMNAYSVSFNLGTHGTRTGGGELAQTVNHGAAAAAPTLTVETGWTFTGWDAGFSSVTSNLAVNAQYTQNVYHLTVLQVPGSGAGGAVAVSVPPYHYGQVVSLQAYPGTGYTFGGWSGDLSGQENPATVVMNGDRTVTATFIRNTYTINATAGANGAISPAGNVGVSYGANATFAITPDSGYHVADVLVDGSSVGPVTSFTFNNVDASHNISATFALTSPSWDVNGDHVCNVLDMISVGGRIGQSGAPGWVPEDINKDGAISVLDLISVGSHIGQGW